MPWKQIAGNSNSNIRDHHFLPENKTETSSRNECAKLFESMTITSLAWYLVVVDSLIGPFLVVILSLRMESHSPTTTFHPKWKRDFFSLRSLLPSWPAQNAIILAILAPLLQVFQVGGPIKGPLSSAKINISVYIVL